MRLIERIRNAGTSREILSAHYDLNRLQRLGEEYGNRPLNLESESFMSITRSIAVDGIQVPLLAIKSFDPGMYYVLGGEHRKEAARYCYQNRLSSISECAKKLILKEDFFVPELNKLWMNFSEIETKSELISLKDRIFLTTKGIDPLFEKIMNFVVDPSNFVDHVHAVCNEIIELIDIKIPVDIVNLEISPSKLDKLELAEVFVTNNLRGKDAASEKLDNRALAIRLSDQGYAHKDISDLYKINEGQLSTWLSLNMKDAYVKEQFLAGAPVGKLTILSKYKDWRNYISDKEISIAANASDLEAALKARKTPASKEVKALSYFEMKDKTFNFSRKIFESKLIELVTQLLAFETIDLTQLTAEQDFKFSILMAQFNLLMKIAQLPYSINPVEPKIDWVYLRKELVIIQEAFAK